MAGLELTNLMNQSRERYHSETTPNNDKWKTKVQDNRDLCEGSLRSLSTGRSSGPRPRKHMSLPLPASEPFVNSVLTDSHSYGYDWHGSSTVPEPNDGCPSVHDIRPLIRDLKHFVFLRK
ncbi:hypothetical protein SK128_001421 [Halocaridina rubra]|uniref:Uncharacterized protein n=1 Tax=Halocaridina rubra TaxID=373956 RepID=A0AAN8XEV2_HALRR